MPVFAGTKPSWLSLTLRRRRRDHPIAIPAFDLRTFESTLYLKVRWYLLTIAKQPSSK